MRSRRLGMSRMRIVFIAIGVAVNSPQFKEGFAQCTNEVKGEMESDSTGNAEMDATVEVKQEATSGREVEVAMELEREAVMTVEAVKVASPEVFLGVARAAAKSVVAAGRSPR